MTDLKQFEDDFVLLVEGGFVAVSRMEEDLATKMFEGALTLKPGHFAPKMGMAAIHLHKMEAKQAAAILEPLVKEDPDNHRACALLGISYLLSGQKPDEGEKLLKKAMNESDDPATQKLGALWNDVILVLKDKGPAHPQPPKENA